MWQKLGKFLCRKVYFHLKKLRKEILDRSWDEAVRSSLVYFLPSTNQRNFLFIFLSFIFLSFLSYLFISFSAGHQPEKLSFYLPLLLPLTKASFRKRLSYCLCRISTVLELPRKMLFNSSILEKKTHFYLVLKLTHPGWGGIVGDSKCQLTLHWFPNGGAPQPHDHIKNDRKKLRRCAPTKV